MTGQELQWHDLRYAWLFAVVAVFIGLTFWHFQWKSQVMRRLGELPLIKKMLSNVSITAQYVRWGFMLGAMVLLVTAILRPQYGTREAELQNRGIDVVMVLDLSKSMLVRDVAPNRLKAAVVEMNSVLDSLNGGRVALVPFAGTAFTQTPLTTDFDAVRDYLARLRVEDMPIGGTKIGLALNHAIKLFGDAEQDADDDDDPDLEGLEQPKPSHYKAIILVTDGENHDEDALAAAQLAAGKNIRVYTVGIGSQNSTARIPQVGDEGDRVGWVADETNKPVFSDLNVALLKDISDASNGLSAVYGRDNVTETLVNSLDSLEKKEYEHQYESLSEDRFQFVLIPALILLVLESLILDRRRRRRRLA
ncbi:MAG: Ca-activated chloride channel family protein [Polyangiales bacterium]|jgi:Ca-activated chloride channel family protein